MDPQIRVWIQTNSASRPHQKGFEFETDPTQDSKTGVRIPPKTPNRDFQIWHWVRKNSGSRLPTLSLPMPSPKPCNEASNKNDPVFPSTSVLPEKAYELSWTQLDKLMTPSTRTHENKKTKSNNPFSRKCAFHFFSIFFHFYAVGKNLALRF